VAMKYVSTLGRYAVISIIVAYLFIVWIYFKTNAMAFDSNSFIIWFMVIPIVFIIFILALRWRRKRLEKQKQHPSTVSAKERSDTPPDSLALYLHSSLCLPEGQSWSEIIANTEDLTVLSNELLDEDQLPVLIKPIGYLDDSDLDNHIPCVDDTALDDDTALEVAEQQSSPNVIKVTHRLCMIIDELLTLSEPTLSAIAECLVDPAQRHSEIPNSAISIHPDWQQRYIANSTGGIEDDIRTTHPFLTQLSIKLLVPLTTDIDAVKAYVTTRLAEYSITESLLVITAIELDSAETCQADSILAEHLTTMSQQATPEISLCLAAESQTNAAWLAEHHITASPTYDSTYKVPSETGVLVLAWNEAAQKILAINDVLISECRYSLTPFDFAESKPARQQYSHILKKIARYLTDSGIPADNLDTQPNKSNPSTSNTNELRSADDKGSIINNPLIDKNIYFLSDINPVKQPYDLSEIMQISDAIRAKGVLVNDYNLGHYGFSNDYLKSLISISLFINLSQIIEQESDTTLLITQHARYCLLWQADTIKTPEDLP